MKHPHPFLSSRVSTYYQLIRIGALLIYCIVVRCVPPVPYCLLPYPYLYSRTSYPPILLLKDKPGRNVRRDVHAMGSLHSSSARMPFEILGFFSPRMALCALTILAYADASVTGSSSSRRVDATTSLDEAPQMYSMASNPVKHCCAPNGPTEFQHPFRVPFELIYGTRCVHNTC